ncbi:hypothetical protein NU688_07245 [Variovorax sp. ZS18.2.2]|uniref:hypothetical protein n=1 Tax=Variovorax sp. ZS18.2.2 TaxID=2971255 RepID=UPI002151ECF9|nr:hypothetical protein [Variovorax sp. ZS18.2.2]MCR6475945.1 hypothetical protein [Variovorax sp. ZS18.2.2]
MSIATNFLRERFPAGGFQLSKGLVIQKKRRDVIYKLKTIFGKSRIAIPKKPTRHRWESNFPEWLAPKNPL